MTNLHKKNIDRLSSIIQKTKQVLSLDFIGYQSIEELKDHLHKNEAVIISGSTCKPYEIDDNSIKWITNSPKGAYFGMHFHEWNEYIEMTKGECQINIFNGTNIERTIILNQGDSITIDSGVAHDFRNIGDSDLECKVIHFK